MADYAPRIRLSQSEHDMILRKRELEEVISDKRVLVIGDLHAPFIKYGYLEFCQQISYIL